MVGQSSALKANRVVIGVGLVFIFFFAVLNIRSSHNWGDDFAQYILQARNIVENRSQFDTGVVQNGWSTLRQIPDATPIGWPLLLAIPYAIFGNSIFHFGQFVAIFTAVFVYFAWIYFKKYWSTPYSLLLMIAVCCNPWLIEFKSSILTDIPFAACVLGVLLLFIRRTKPSWSTTLMMGLIAGYATAIRPAGIALLASIIIYSIYLVWRKRQSLLSALVHQGGVVVVGITLSILLNTVIFPTGIGSSYYGFWAKRIMQTTSTTSFALHQTQEPKQSLGVKFIETFAGEVKVFSQLVPSTGFQLLDALARVIFLVAIGFGLFVRLHRPRIIEYFFIIYFFMLIVIQIRPEQGFRYLLPLLPFTFEYFLVFLRFLSEVFQFLAKRVRRPKLLDTTKA